MKTQSNWVILVKKIEWLVIIDGKWKLDVSGSMIDTPILKVSH